MNTHINVIKILQQIITQYGPPTESNLIMYRGLMHDLLVDHTRELNLLKITLEQGQIFRLIKDYQTIPYDMLFQQIVNHLHSTFGMDKTAAKWAIDTWAEALGIHLTCTCIADFSLSQVQGAVPHSVSFSNTSKGEVSRFEWDFGDGERSLERDPIHVYKSPGTYTVILYAFKDSYVSEKKVTDAVTAEWPELKAEIHCDVSEGELPLVIQFTSHGQGMVKSFDWDFGDEQHSAEQNPIHIYTKVGLFQVSLTVSDENSSVVATLLEPVSVAPQKIRADFSYSATDTENPLFLQFTDNSLGERNRYQWDFGDGTVSEEQHPSHRFNSPGIYHVSLKVTNEATGENDSIVRQISIRVTPPEAVFSLDKSEGIPPLHVRFTNQSRGYFCKSEWDFGDGSASDEENPTHSYEKPGRYSVCLVVSNGLDSSKSLKKFGVIVIPSGFNAEFICRTPSGQAPLNTSFIPKYSNPAATYHWKFGDGKESFDQNPTHEYSEPGNYSVSLGISVDGFIDESKQKNLIEILPNLNTTPDIKLIDEETHLEIGETKDVLSGQPLKKGYYSTMGDEGPINPPVTIRNTKYPVENLAFIGILLLIVIGFSIIFSNTPISSDYSPDLTEPTAQSSMVANPTPSFTISTSDLSTPSPEYLYENPSLALSGSEVQIGISTNNVFQIEYKVKPQYIKDHKFVFEGNSMEGHDVYTTNVNPASYALIRVQKEGSNEIVSEDGFGNEFTTDLTKTIKVPRIGKFLIKIKGNLITLDIRIKENKSV